MAFLQVNFFSHTLNFNMEMNVILPEKKCPFEDGKWPTLYLLHGYSGDHMNWQRYTSVERYVRDLDLAVVMPSVHNGFYTNMKTGQRYWDFISEELPALCERMFPLTAKREGRFAAGLSMGGYGALKLGLRQPERFAAVASLSGVVDVYSNLLSNQSQSDAEQRKVFENIFGTLDMLKGSDDDLVAVADRLLKNGGTLPKIYVACGTEDFLYRNNVDFLKRFEKPMGIHVEEGPGAHTWDFWDAYIERVLAWLPLGK